MSRHFLALWAMPAFALVGCSVALAQGATAAAGPDPVALLGAGGTAGLLGAGGMVAWAGRFVGRLETLGESINDNLKELLILQKQSADANKDNGTKLTQIHGDVIGIHNRIDDATEERRHPRPTRG
jgi:hypothetical protein